MDSDRHDSTIGQRLLGKDGSGISEPSDIASGIVQSFCQDEAIDQLGVLQIELELILWKILGECGALARIQIENAYDVFVGRCVIILIERISPVLEYRDQNLVVGNGDGAPIRHVRNIPIDVWVERK